MQEGDKVRINNVEGIWEVHYTPRRKTEPTLTSKKGLVTLSREINGRTFWRRVELDRIVKEES